MDKKILLVHVDDGQWDKGNIACTVLTSNVFDTKKIIEETQSEYWDIENVFFSDLLSKNLTKAGIEFEMPDFEEVYD
jgi:hypothetical protein